MNQERLMQVLVSPIVSEKSTLAGELDHQVVFAVLPDATKPEIRKAVELLFDVKVDQVRVLNRPGKVKRFGRMTGRRSAVRKAYVKLAEGHDIDFGAGA